MARGSLQKLAGLKQRKKPGPKPKSIRDRILNSDSIKPIQRVERSYSRETKIKVLKFHILYRIPIEGRKDQYRAPTLAETSSMFLIPESTVHSWVRKEKEIVEQPSGSYAGGKSSFFCKWPELEISLYELFLSQRAEGKIVRRGWFRRHAKQLFNTCYPLALDTIFVFSLGWFSGFLYRHHISIRFTTNKAQKIPDDYRRMIINWLRFNRRVSQPQNFFEKAGLISDIGRYLLSNIANLDETPIPFEYLDGRTYDTIGLKTIWAKSTKSGWDKRQASLILMVFADGIPRVKPKVIFHALTGANIWKKEGHLYDTRVTVEFNSTAYNNEQVFIQQIEREIAPAFEGRPSLFVLDAATFHKTDRVLNILSNYKIMPSMIPGGCTSLIQPLDVSINRPFKDLLQEEVEMYIEYADESGKSSWSIGDRRVMTTICVGRAWEKFCQEKSHVVRQSFCNVGLALPIDGSRDSQALNIKGFTAEDLDIGDWTSDLDPSILAEHRSLEESSDDSPAVDYIELE